MAKSMAKALAAAAILALLLSAAAAAQVPDPFARELAQRLARADRLVGEHGYARAAGPFAGGLGQRLTRRFQVTLRAGQEYRILGVCDERCGDLDLRLYDAFDNLLAEDVLEDAVPALQVRPAATGVQVIEVSMPQCAATQCWYALNVYSR